MSEASHTLVAEEAPQRGHVGCPVLDVVIPVHDEQHTVAACVRRLHAHLTATFPYPFRITIADNASTDDTSVVAADLRRELPEVELVRLAGAITLLPELALQAEDPGVAIRSLAGAGTHRDVDAWTRAGAAARPAVAAVLDALRAVSP